MPVACNLAAPSPMMSLRATVLLLVTCWAFPARAAIIQVDTTTDERNSDGDCSLREAIVAANTDAASDACGAGSGTDQINVPAGTYSLTITGAGEEAALTGDLDLTASVQIIGAAGGTTVVESAGMSFGDRIFEVGSAATVTMTDLTIAQGYLPSNGGGGIAIGGTLTCTRCLLRDSVAYWGGGIMVSGSGALTMSASTVTANTGNQDGGGIYMVTGSATITTSSISGNAAVYGGGINNLGGFLNLRESTMSGNTATDGAGFLTEGAISILKNVTVSGNTASAGGGGVVSRSSGTLDGSNLTITANSAAQGGGLRREAGSVTLRNSIVAGNTASGSGTDCSSTITSDGYNLFGTSGCPGSVVTGDVSGVSAELGSLADNGGLTLTHLPSATSPAVDLAHPGTPGTTGACQLTDQRGTTRPGGLRCDKGAVERATSGTTSTTTSTTTATTMGTTSSTTTTTTTMAASTTSTPTTSSNPTTSTAAPTTTLTTATSTTTTTQPPAAPTPCAQSLPLTGLRVTYAPLAAGGGALAIRGTLELPPDPAFALAPNETGVQIRWSTAGARMFGDGPAEFDPAIAATTPCAAGDGWRGFVYRSRLAAVPPACTPNSGGGLVSLKILDRRSRGRGVGFAARVRGPGVFAPPAVLDAALVFSDAAVPASDAACVRSQPVACVPQGRRRLCKADTP
jgi:CSLREA domain-containing protein